MLIDMIFKDKGNIVEMIFDKIILLDVVKMLDQKRIGVIVVVDDNGELCGVLLECDIVWWFVCNGGKMVDMMVVQVMICGVIMVDLVEDVDICFGCMIDCWICYLFVVENGKFIGIILIGDLVKYKIDFVLVEVEVMEVYICSG